jgi:hypothetical protein
MPDSLTYKQLSQLVSPLEIYQLELHAPFSLSVFFGLPYLSSFNQFLNHLTKFTKQTMGATLLQDKQITTPCNE